MSHLKIGHIGLHVRNLEEEIAFFEMLGAELTSIDRLPRRSKNAKVKVD